MHLSPPFSIRLVATTLLWWLYGCAVAAQPQVKIDHLSIRDGLAHRWVLDVLQDRHGLLWVATYDGLCRYDGRQFVIYRNRPHDPNSLSDNRVVQLAEDHEGMIWINTETGVNRFNPVTNRFERMVAWQEEGLASCFITDDKSRVWRILKPRDRTDRIELQEFSALQTNERPIYLQGASSLFWLQQDGPGTLIGYSVEGYWHIDLLKRQAHALGVDGQVAQLPQHLHAPTDKQGRLWYYDNRKKTLCPVKLPASLSNPDFRVFTDRGQGNKWLASARGEIWRLDEDFNRFVRVADKAGDGKIFPDRDGMLWSCSQQGLYKIRQSEPLFEHSLSIPFAIGEMPPIGFSARSLVELPDGRVFVARDGELLEATKGRTYQFEKSIIALDVWQMVVDRNGVIWFSSSFPGKVSLSSYDPATGLVRSFFHPAKTNFHVAPWLFQDKNGLLRIFYNNEAWAFDPQKERFSNLSAPLPLIDAALYDASTNGILCVSEGNLFRVDCSTDKVALITRLFKTGDIHAPVAKAIALHDNRIWVGTTKGLYAVGEEGQRIDHFDRSNGIPHEIVYTILPDHSFLWLGTHEGLCRFNIKSLEARNFFVEDGLPHNEFNSRSALRTSDGRIWMGGLNGLSLFDPRRFDEVKEGQRAQLLWSRCTWFDARKDTLTELPLHDLNPPASLTIEPGNGNYTFSFAISNYAEPKLHTFSWFLEGADKTWSAWNNNSVVFFKTLPVGSYTLRVRGKDDRGHAVVNELAIPLQVLQVWYLRWWAIALYAILASSLLIVLFRFQLARRLEHAETLRLRALDELKNRLYTHITHEFRTPLTLLLGPVEGLLSRWREEYSTELRHTLLSVQQNAHRLLHLVNQILDLRKLEEKRIPIQWVQGDIMLLLRYIAHSFHSLAEKKNIRFTFEKTPASLWMDYDKDKLLKITGNLLSNAFKFTPENGRVELIICKEEQRLRIAVRDSGRGISPAYLPQIFEPFFQAPDHQGIAVTGTGIGLALSRELAELMGGSLQVESAENEGSLFVLLLPIHQLATEKDNMQEAENAILFAGEMNISREPVWLTPELSAEAPLALVVEDNAEIARYVAHCLSEKFRVDFAANGKEGLEKALALVPDIVVSDLMMPVMDGFELTQSLKNDDRTSHIPVVLLTARAEIATRLEGLRRGADAYLSKPFNEEELLILATQQILLRRRLQARYANLLAPADIENPALLPDLDGYDPVREDAFFKRVLETAEQYLDDAGFGSEELAKAVLISQSQLNRKLNALTGKSSVQILRDLRLRRAQTLLLNHELSVSEAAWDAGFNDPAYFTRIFTREFGVSPSVWREKNH